MRKATNKNDINFDKYQHLPIKVEKVEDTKRSVDYYDVILKDKYKTI